MNQKACKEWFNQETPCDDPPANGRAASPPPYESDGGRAMADERWRTVSWRMNKNLCLRRPVSEPGPLRMRDCRADHWTTETSCAWRRDMAVRAARGARRSTSPIITTQMCIPTALLPLSVTDAGAHSNDSNNNYTDVHSTVTNMKH
ncbi:hypothetical protein J6590_023429 [Homalodisca vitripennis]|nr:hypothetical protein J6590_023429 [Homalodisca vitripennis]